MTTNYITREQLKVTLEMSNQAYADEDIAAAITAASRGIDEACQRRFFADSDALQVRYYSPANWTTVMIDDLAVLTELATDQSGDGTFSTAWTRNTDFVLEPLNAPADGWPYTRIRTHPRRVTAGLPAWWPRSVRVTGQFGWAAVPGAITEATTILASQLLKRAREAPFGIVAFGDAGATARLATTDPSVRFLVAPYMREKPLT